VGIAKMAAALEGERRQEENKNSQSLRGARSSFWPWRHGASREGGHWLRFSFTKRKWIVQNTNIFSAIEERLIG
jgi:hypothetical protein